jgi:hypothetical protein
MAAMGSSRSAKAVFWGAEVWFKVVACGVVMVRVTVLEVAPGGR